MIYLDQLNRELKLKTTPKRIVSLVPSQTELLVDLGLESSIVGLTKFCVHPSNLREHKMIVGGTKQVNFNKIKALQPDIILCNKEENTKDMILELEKIAPVHISDVYNLNDAQELIQLYGRLFAIVSNSEILVERIKTARQNFSKHIKNQPNLNVVYFIWKDPWMVAANHTFIDAMLGLNGFDNLFKAQDRYPEISFDDIEANVNVIMLSSEPYPFKEEHIKYFEERFSNSRVVLVDGEYFSWYGSRLLKAFDYFKTLRQQLNSCV